MNPEFEQLEPSQTWNKRKVGLTALVVGILLVVVGVASSGRAENDGQLVRQTAIEKMEHVHDQNYEAPGASVVMEDLTSAADVPAIFHQIKSDALVAGWTEVMTCSDTWGGQFWWKEWGIKLVGLQALAVQKVVKVRMYMVQGGLAAGASKSGWVETRVDNVGPHSPYWNMRTNNHLNEVKSGKGPANYLANHYKWAPASMKDHLTFNKPNGSPSTLATGGFVYWANGNQKGLHVHKAKKQCTWTWNQNQKANNAQMVFMFYKVANCV